MNKTNIEWTDATWNPIRGCSRVSEGCRNCYAERIAARFSFPAWEKRSSDMYEPPSVYPSGAFVGLANMTKGGPRWTGEIKFVQERLNDPLHWKNSRCIFVNSMSDLFHEKVLDEWLDKIFIVMSQAHWHTFQILTKRPQRMKQYMEERVKDGIGLAFPWPPHNVWLGVSVEDQKCADERIPLLLDTPAAIRFISAEPLLGPIELDGDDYSWRGWLRGWHCEPEHYRGCDGICDNCPVPIQVENSRINWVIIGGESGPNARPTDISWIRRIIKECAFSHTPCFVKQLGKLPYNSAGPGLGPYPDIFDGNFAKFADHAVSLRNKKGADWHEWPTDLRVQDYPNVLTLKRH